MRKSDGRAWGLYIRSSSEPENLFIRLLHNYRKLEAALEKEHSTKTVKHGKHNLKTNKTTKKSELPKCQSQSKL